ncbi:MAG: LPXTG cell wall anchor domain-containing protein, partial [Oscillospiraceae bacterium]|nr:LPXTG cell wall anchor domain-containing protein [Oscillospiraceae bacterium]
YFFTFEGAPSLKNEATISVEADYFEDAFVYEFDGEKLREVKAKLNEDEDAYEWTSSKLTTYVVSDTKLKADGTVSGSGESTDDNKTETNPNTGANDVVGLAAGLAVVSLVAGGAVMLKKKEN